MKCDMCGKEIIPGNDEYGIPNGVSFQLKDGKIINACSECICALGDNAEEFEDYSDYYIPGDEEEDFDDDMSQEDL